jgi:hypothetical protein
MLFPNRRQSDHFGRLIAPVLPNFRKCFFDRWPTLKRGQQKSPAPIAELNP